MREELIVHQNGYGLFTVHRGPTREKSGIVCRRVSFSSGRRWVEVQD